MDDLTRRRAERNEAVFRAVNEEIDEQGEGRVREYVCECADPECTTTIRLTHAEYEAVRARPSQFVIASGHQKPGLERVVEVNASHLVVEK